MKSYDLNCDLGEGIGNDAEIMPYLSSCNIACGGHFGDLHTITETINLAQIHKVKVGAHPSFPDKENFGRKIITISKQELSSSLSEQLLLFKQACDELKVKMHHVKLHGALYNLAAADTKTAQIVLEVFKSSCPETIIYAPFNSKLAKLAKDEFKVHYEAFADRRYHNNLQLVSRNKENAVITEASQACQQVMEIVKTGKVETIEAEKVPIKADTFCVHGDQLQAVSIAKTVFNYLKKTS